MFPPIVGGTASARRGQPIPAGWPHRGANEASVGRSVNQASCRVRRRRGATRFGAVSEKCDIAKQVGVQPAAPNQTALSDWLQPGKIRRCPRVIASRPNSADRAVRRHRSNRARAAANLRVNAAQVDAAVLRCQGRRRLTPIG